MFRRFSLNIKELDQLAQHLAGIRVAAAIAVQANDVPRSGLAESVDVPVDTVAGWGGDESGRVGEWGEECVKLLDAVDEYTEQVERVFSEGRGGSYRTTFSSQMTPAEGVEVADEMIEAIRVIRQGCEHARGQLFNAFVKAKPGKAQIEPLVGKETRATLNAWFKLQPAVPSDSMLQALTVPIPRFTTSLDQPSTSQVPSVAVSMIGSHGAIVAPPSRVGTSASGAKPPRQNSAPSKQGQGQGR